MWTNNNNKEASQNWFHQVLLERKVNKNILKQHNLTVAHKTKLGQNQFLELDQKEMTAFILHFKQHHPHSEIASILGISHESLRHLFAGLTTKLKACSSNNDKP